GRPDSPQVSENAPLEPRSPYGAAKVGAEAVARAYTASHGLGCVALRPFSVYGPRQSRNGVFEAILRQAVHSDRVELDDLGSVRDWCYVADVAAAVRLAVQRAMPGEFRAYNVSSGQGVSVGHLANRIVRAAGRSVPVVARDRPERPRRADIRHLVADTRRIEAELGWRPTTRLDTGIEETVAWFRSLTSTD
ncbi:MAG: GDP-mannose 4,6-dehydratase, partial [Deltaproteobacteria bacterium]|nr:GDP-mannose 4,6-dehydratase [Deltaproteobacteria bacterium]